MLVFDVELSEQYSLNSFPGIVLYEAAGTGAPGGSTKGRVLFSLKELPSGTVFYLESGVKIERIRDKVVIDQVLELSI
jgi:hypothetical protein